MLHLPQYRLLFSQARRQEKLQLLLSSTIRVGFAPHSLLCLPGNVVARDAGIGVDTLVVSGDSRLLAFVGPSKYIVTVMEACSLDEVRTQQTPLAPGDRGVPWKFHRQHPGRWIREWGTSPTGPPCFPFRETEITNSRFLLLWLHSPLEGEFGEVLWRLSALTSLCELLSWALPGPAAPH